MRKPFLMSIEPAYRAPSAALPEFLKAIFPGVYMSAAMPSFGSFGSPVSKMMEFLAKMLQSPPFVVHVVDAPGTYRETSTTVAAAEVLIVAVFPKSIGAFVTIV